MRSGTVTLVAALGLAVLLEVTPLEVKVLAIVLASVALGATWAGKALEGVVAGLIVGVMLSAFSGMIPSMVNDLRDTNPGDTLVIWMFQQTPLALRVVLFWGSFQGIARKLGRYESG